MPITPDTATEIDAYQGNPALAVGQSGNLPFFPSLSPEVVNAFTKITDNYVAKKQKDYDQWQTNVANKTKEISSTLGALQSDLPELKKQQLDLKQFIVKNPSVFAVGADVNNPKYDEFLQKENSFLTNYELSKHHAELDKEYKRLSTQKAFQNDAFKDQYEKFKSAPISERTPFMPIMDDDDALQTNLQRILNMDEYKNPQKGTVTPEYDVNGNATGSTIRTNPYSYEIDRIIPNLIQYNRDIDAYRYDNGIGLSDAEKAMTKDEYHLEQLKKRIPQGILEGKITIGSDYNTKMAIGQQYWKERDAINEQQRIEAENRKNQNKINLSNKYPQADAVISETESVFSIDPSKGKKINLPAPLQVMKGDMYDITAELKSNNPTFYEDVVSSNIVNVGGGSEGVATKVYMNVSPDKTKTFILGNDEAIDYNSKLSRKGVIDQMVNKRKIAKEYSEYIQEGGDQGSNTPTSKSEAKGGQSVFGIDEMVWNKMGHGYNDGKKVEGIKWKNHDDHIHIGATDPTTMLSIIKKAKSLGLNTTQNPFTGKVDKVHTDTSWHYKNFEGDYEGKKLGNGLDVSGDESKMKELFEWVEGNKSTSQPKESTQKKSTTSKKVWTGKFDSKGKMIYK